MAVQLIGKYRLAKSKYLIYKLLHPATRVMMAEVSCESVFLFASR